MTGSRDASPAVPGPASDATTSRQRTPPRPSPPLTPRVRRLPWYAKVGIVLGLLVLAGVGGWLAFYAWEGRRCRELLADAQARGWLEFPRPELALDESAGDGVDRLLDFQRLYEAQPPGAGGDPVDGIGNGELDAEWRARARAYLEDRREQRALLVEALERPLVFPVDGDDPFAWEFPGIQAMRYASVVLRIEAVYLIAQDDVDVDAEELTRVVERLLALRASRHEIQTLLGLMVHLAMDQELFQLLRLGHAQLPPALRARLCTELAGPPPIPLAAAMRAEFATKARVMAMILEGEDVSWGWGASLWQRPFVLRALRPILEIERIAIERAEREPVPDFSDFQVERSALFPVRDAFNIVGAYRSAAAKLGAWRDDRDALLAELCPEGRAPTARER